MNRPTLPQSSLALSLLVVFANGAFAAACIGEPRVGQLHREVPFTSILLPSVETAPGRAPLIAFLGQQDDEPTYALWLHHCLDDVCSPGTTARLHQLDFSYTVAPRVLRRAGDRPLVVNSSPFAISLFDCADAACSTGVNRELLRVAPLDVVAAVRSDGRPVIAFHNQGTRTIDLILCGDANCTQSTQKPITAPYSGNARPEVVLALTGDDRPVIGRTSFGDGAPFLDLILCESPACDAPTTRPIAATFGFALEIAMRSDDRPVVHFANVDNEGKLAVCSDPACTTAPTRDLTGFTSGVLIGADDLPILESVLPGAGYYACESEDCALQGDRQALAPTHAVSYIDSGIGNNDRPFFVWIDENTRTLHTATCDTSAVWRGGFEPALDASAADAGP